jgi:hypothetical protein
MASNDAQAPPNVSDPTNGNWMNKSYDILNGSLGIAKFNQAIPLIISAIAIGVSLVNRKFTKCLGHVIGATFVALISVGIIARSNGSLCNQFTTAFLWYTIFYVGFCMQSSKTIDDMTMVGIAIGFVILLFVDFVTFLGGVCASVGSSTYIGMMLMGIAGGIAGYYATQSFDNGAALYDFSGCSCDNCTSNKKCSTKSKPQTMMVKQMTS